MRTRSLTEELGDRVVGLDRKTVVGANGHFILDRAPSVEGLCVAFGCGGTEFKIAPAVELGMGELVTEGRASSVDLTPPRATRFAEGRPLRGEHEYHDRHYDQSLWNVDAVLSDGRRSPGLASQA